MERSDEKKLHSEQYFNGERDHWWNADFLALVARRWEFQEVRSVLDVGCGVGHWTRALLPHLPADAHITGIDPEPEWVARAKAAATTLGLESRIACTAGTAERIPFPDESFDLVTCQTVLIHVRDCGAALLEMKRVLRPGGRMVAAEPNNLACALILGSTQSQKPLEERLALVEFQALCELGKVRLGEGNNSIGDLLPGLCAEAGFVDVQVFQSDRALPLIPPYSDPAAQAACASLISDAQQDLWIWDRQDTYRYFVAGGGDESDFEIHWARAIAAVRFDAASIQRGEYDSAGGHVTYLVSGRKPRAPSSQG